MNRPAIVPTKHLTTFLDSAWGITLLEVLAIAAALLIGPNLFN